MDALQKVGFAKKEYPYWYIWTLQDEDREIYIRFNKEFKTLSVSNGFPQKYVQALADTIEEIK